ncbi:hypothetical protein CL653_03845 [bacterium]|nr:hypothetical protein [bacterium]
MSWAATAGSGGRDGDTTGSGARDGDMAGDATGASVGIKNPLGDKTIQDFFLDLLDVLLVFALPIIVFFIIYSGFLYVTARGNAVQIKTASRALLYSVLGGVIILGARLILAVIQGTVDSFVS